MVRAVECVTNEMPVPGEKVNIVLMCVMTLMASILRFIENITSVFENTSISPSYSMVEDV
jgi:hypothetical protein